MNKKEYIEKYGYISNKDFKIASSIQRDLNISIKDWKLPIYQLLNKYYIQLMIELRLHIKHNCRSDFKNNFWDMKIIPKNRGVYAVNYTGHTLKYNGNKFFGDYKFCINKNRKAISSDSEDLYFIDGMYPIYSITSCLQEDIEKVKNTNPSWWNKEIIPIKIIPYINTSN